MAKKILLADDSLTIQKVVELTFSDGDYDLVCVSNGQKALDKVRDDRPDLILADVVMPEKNGYEVCEAIKGNPATARIPVVLLSGTFEPFDRERAERIGCDAIVSKPFDSQQLISQIEGLLGKARAEMPEPETRSEPDARAGSSQASERAPFDAGFTSEDFTASIRVSPRPERFDP
ncbi:MAG: response regulator, partial [Thermoanaerobaculia bacterium]